MSYHKNLVVVLKTNGQILREKNGEVQLPFNSEYSILFKNLNSRKSVIDLFIDGEGMQSFVINSNSSLELEGFLDRGTVKNKFKFIQKTEKIIQHRGNKIDDGLIRIEYRFEREEVDLPVYPQYNYWSPYVWERPYGPYYPYYPYVTWESSIDGTSGDSSYIATSSQNQTHISYNSIPLEDEGITVKGSKTKQDFEQNYTKELESNSYVIILKLKGIKPTGKIVEGPVTVKTKLECPICGTKSNSDATFCKDCGTYLE